MSYAPDGMRAAPALRAWPHVRAALVGLHILAIILLATPSPAVGLRRSLWKDPTVQQEFAAWHERLAGLGLTWSEPELEDHLWNFAVGWEKYRSALLTPFNPYGRYLGASQSWRMFVAPHRYPTRLAIDLRENGIWRVIFQERSDECAWRRSLFDHDRMRSVIFRLGWPQYKKSWGDFSRWIAGMAAEDFPAADMVRTRMFKYRTPSPEEVLAGKEPEGADQQQQEIPLAPLREAR